MRCLAALVSSPLGGPRDGHDALAGPSADALVALFALVSLLRGDDLPPPPAIGLHHDRPPGCPEHFGGKLHLLLASHDDLLGDRPQTAKHALVDRELTADEETDASEAA